jgi:hypothetical protein
LAIEKKNMPNIISKITSAISADLALIEKAQNEVVLDALRFPMFINDCFQFRGFGLIEFRTHSGKSKRFNH